ncbi:hypothetical protein [Octadecabacter antarcticus]|uniref:hypothetical protein n=1 Tax=Octadecabacter antarcticus TaxID=1217908 RepID=UPI0006863310|nr:hypothetical protein [Octadecabacter antarcticus]
METKTHPQMPVRLGKLPKFPKGRKQRAEEFIGGGFFVFCRGESTNRIHPSMWAFEYDSADSAARQADILAAKAPGEIFEVFVRLSSHAVAESVETEEAA